MAAKSVSPASPLGEKHIFENQTVKLGMYHAGYLTIDGAEDGIVSLRIPNEEIADSISHGYIAYCLRDRGDEFAIKAQRTGKEIAEKGISYVGAALPTLTESD